VVTADNGEQALELVGAARPAIMVLDTRLPERSGIDVMQAVHDERNVPVILLSGEGDGGEKVRALDLGADDYLVKPFSPEELSARVRAVLRRTHARQPGLVVRMDGVEVDLGRHTVMRHGSQVRLTRTEWMLLEHLIANAGHVLMNRDLLEKVWGPQYTNDLQYLRVWISRLRRKLEADPSNPRFIKTYAGIGYMLQLAPQPA
jgi:two-component system KDP operon response regulator KdpE